MLGAALKLGESLSSRCIDEVHTDLFIRITVVTILSLKTLKVEAQSKHIASLRRIMKGDCDIETQGFYSFEGQRIALAVFKLRTLLSTI